MSAFRPPLRNPWWIPPFLGGVPEVDQRVISLLGAVSLALFFEQYDNSMLTSALKFIAADLGMPEQGLASFLALIKLGALPAFEGWELHLLHTKPLAYRPAIPRALRDRTHVRTVRRPELRARALGEASIFVPAPGGEARLALEAKAAGAAVSDPEVVADLVADAQAREAVAMQNRAYAQAQSFDVLATQLELSPPVSESHEA